MSEEPPSIKQLLKINAVQATKLAAQALELERLKGYLQDIIKAQKVYEMNPSWAVRNQFKTLIHCIAKEVYPEMKWVKQALAGKEE